jgi:hypothetical protein
MEQMERWWVVRIQIGKCAREMALFQAAVRLPLDRCQLREAFLRSRKKLAQLRQNFHRGTAPAFPPASLRPAPATRPRTSRSTFPDPRSAAPLHTAASGSRAPPQALEPGPGRAVRRSHAPPGKRTRKTLTRQRSTPRRHKSPVCEKYFEAFSITEEVRSRSGTSGASAFQSRKSL